MPAFFSYRNQLTNCYANQLTGFYMGATLAINGLRVTLIFLKNSQETADVVIFTNEILDGKLRFMCSVSKYVFILLYQHWHLMG